jgi:Mrp family chromosome partitioning ATPase
VTQPARADAWSSQPAAGAASHSPRRYASSFLDHWLLILLVVVAALAATFAYTQLVHERYEAHARIVVTPLPPNDTTFLGITSLLRDSSQGEPVVTAAQAFSAPQVKNGVKRRLGLQHPPPAKVTPLGQSNVVDIAATAEDRDAAARAANAYAQAGLALRSATIQRELNATIDRLQTNLDALKGNGAQTTDAVIRQHLRLRLARLNALIGSPDPTTSLLSRATAPDSASWPRTNLSLLVAFLCALLLGAGLALLLDYLDPSVKDEEELRKTNGLNVLARVPFASNGDLARSLGARESARVLPREDYRLLRSVLTGTERTGRRSPGVIVVSSVGREDGKTAVAVGLARAFADAGQHVVVVDGDMRRPGVTPAFGSLAPTAGLAELLRGQTRLELTLVPVEPGMPLRLLPAAPDNDAPDLLASDRTQGLFSALRELADVVVVDTPPSDEAADVYAFAGLADVVVLCARPGRTEKRPFGELLRRLGRLGVPPAGVVVVGKAVKWRGTPSSRTAPAGVPRPATALPTPAAARTVPTAGVERSR